MAHKNSTKFSEIATENREFLERKYVLDRSHELELNKFTHVLEVERLKLLLLLNGGSAGLWLGFLESADNTGTIAVEKGLPVLLWLAGTLLAAFAFHKALATQRAFTQAYHNRRRLYEWYFLDAGIERAELRLLLASPDLTIDGEAKYASEEDYYGASAERGRKLGTGAAKLTLWSANLRIITFAAGALAALAGAG